MSGVRAPPAAPPEGAQGSAAYAPGGPADVPSGPLRAGPGRFGRSFAPRASAPRARVRRSVREDFVVFVVSHMTWIAVGAMVTAHLAFAHEAYPMAARLLLAVPGVIALLEARAYLKSGVRELPIGLWALAQLYIVYGFPVFFDLPFFDLAGPVHFSDESRVAAGLVVALGTFSAWVGFRIGLGGGARIRGFMLQAVPPAEVPARWDDAFLVYAGATCALALFTMFSPLPAAISLPVQIVFGIEFALGLALAVPTNRLGGRTAEILALLVGLAGVLRGMLEPIVHACGTYVVGRWFNTGRFALRVVVGCVVLFAILQPAKNAYRRQTWGSSEQVGLAERMGSWERAVAGHDEQRQQESDTEMVIGRLSQLAPVMNVVQIVPSRIDYIMGASMAEVLYMPIPRLIWPGKPTTREQLQARYAVIFGQQTEEGARTTSIGMPLLVEGWWNFGWAGVVLVGLLLGLWSGVAQRAFAGEHWAMRALGYAYFTQTRGIATIMETYGNLFQNFVGQMIAVWAVYGLARILSGRQRRAPATGARAGRPAAAPASPLLAQRAGPRPAPSGRF